jgi:hypothetical protein
MTAKRDPEPRPAPPDEPEGAEILRELAEHSETHPRLTGGDLDADWQRAWSDGEEAVGGSVATPDQDVVDELGRALGVEQPLDAEVRTSEEILGARDRFYWHLERDAEAEAEPPETEGGPGTPPPPRARS